MNTVEDANDFIVAKKKEKLRTLELNPTGNKAELISRLLEADRLGIWMRNVSKASEANMANQAALSPNAD